MSKLIRAISLWQPWASLVALGVKRFETRSWATPHRGELAIHAAKCEPWPLSDAVEPLARAGYARWADLPRGAVLCIVRLVDVLPVELVVGEIVPYSAANQELAFGDYTAGRYAWRLEMVEVFDPPIPVRGAQGLWWWRRPEQEDNRE